VISFAIPRIRDWTMCFVSGLLHDGVDRRAVDLSTSLLARSHTIVQWIRLHTSGVMSSEDGNDEQPRSPHD
jgi:hypothetical protein